MPKATKYLLFLVVCCSLLLSRHFAGAELGNYATVLPAGLTAPPSSKYITSNITGPVPTTKWYSSLISSKYSYYHFAYPLAMNVPSTGNGLQIGYPVITPAVDSITAPFVNDLEIRGYISSASRDLTVSTNAGVLVDDYSDWTVSPLWTDATDTTKTISATYGHGLPFVYFTYSSGCDPKIIFSGSSITAFDSNGVTLGNGPITTNHIGVKYGSKYYGLFAPTDSIFTISGTTITVTMLPVASRYFSVALMTKTSGETDKQVLEYYYQYAYAFVTGSQVSWSYNETSQEVTSTFTLSTVAKEGSQTQTVMSLLPHQYKNSTAAVSDTRYYTVLLGKMKVLAGTGFTTVNTFHGVLPFLPDKGSYDKTHLATLLTSDRDSSLSKTDTYFNGKQVAKIANLIPIAAQLGDTATRDYLVSRLKTVLINWFTYTPGETNRFFYYDNFWKGLIGYEAQFFGYNYTDHHYHYGYLVYAAALLSMYDSSFKDDYGPMVEYLIRDYANWKRDDSMFPFLRHFDPYMGHSYCDGLAQSTKGNNQESSSEAMNAWAAIILWGMVTNNDTIRDTGIYGYTTEYSGIHDYYFNIDQDIYSATYNHPLVGILHDDRIVYDTWWDHANDECVYGIQMIPATASMLYLGYDADYSKRTYDAFLVDNGGPENFSGWYNIFWQFQSMYDPAAVISKYRETISIDSDGDTFSFLYHWIYNFKVMGQVDISAHADTPYYAVFNHSGTRYYTAYNPTANVQKVSFYSASGFLGIIYVRPNSMACYKIFAPEITSWQSSARVNNGSTSLIINGSGFVSGATVKLIKSGQSDIICNNVQVVSASRIEGVADLTGAMPGDWLVTVLNPGNEAEGVGASVLQIIAPAPAITSITPNKSFKVIAVGVSIEGSNFLTGITVKLARSGQADVSATEVNVVNSGQVTGKFDLRAVTEGSWDVVITNADGQAGTLANGFELFVPAGVYVYPNPCKLALNKNIYFVNIPNQASLIIYDLNGERVFRENSLLTNPFAWNLENDLGRKVASGIYLYVIQEGDSLKTGKIAIIK